MAADTLLELAHPFCTKWKTQLPNIKGPFGLAWTAHNECGDEYHIWAIFLGQKSPLLAARISEVE